MKRNLTALSLQLASYFREGLSRDRHHLLAQQELLRHSAMVPHLEALPQQVIGVLHREEVATVVAEVVETTITVALVHDIPDRRHHHVVGAGRTPIRARHLEHPHAEEVRQREARLVVAEDHQATVATAAEVEAGLGAGQSAETAMEGEDERDQTMEGVVKSIAIGSLQQRLRIIPVTCHDGLWAFKQRAISLQHHVGAALR